VFFISFGFKDIATLLRLALPPEQALVLLDREQEGLMELRPREKADPPRGMRARWLEDTAAEITRSLRTRRRQLALFVRDQQDFIRLPQPRRGGPAQVEGSAHGNQRGTAAPRGDR